MIVAEGGEEGVAIVVYRARDMLQQETIAEGEEFLITKSFCLDVNQ